MTLHLKNLMLTRPLAAVDVETTGTDVRDDTTIFHTTEFEPITTLGEPT